MRAMSLFLSERRLFMLAVVYGYRKEWRCPATMAFFVRSITIQQQTSPRRLSSVPQLLGFVGTVSVVPVRRCTACRTLSSAVRKRTLFVCWFCWRLRAETTFLRHLLCSWPAGAPAVSGLPMLSCPGTSTRW